MLKLFLTIVFFIFPCVGDFLCVFVGRAEGLFARGPGGRQPRRENGDPDDFYMGFVLHVFPMFFFCLHGRARPPCKKTTECMSWSFYFWASPHFAVAPVFAFQPRNLSIYGS